MKTKDDIYKILKFFAFISIAILPFISATQIIGMETFLDSYEKPEYYIIINNKENYTIIQKSTHPEFYIENEDTIYYYQANGEISYNKIYEISAIGPIKKYYTLDDKNPIFEQQIIGKIIKKLEENPLNFISIKTWEISIHNLNLRALISD